MVHATLAPAPEAVAAGSRGWERIVLATDFSEGARRAFRRACRLPLAPGATLMLVHATQPPTFETWTADVVPRDLLPGAVQELKADLAAARREDVRVQAFLRHGAPEDAARALVEEGGAQLVVLGRRGLNTLGRVLLGSTAERVVRHLQVPVLVVGQEPEGPYERPFVATDLGRASRRILGTALSLLEPKVPVTLLHCEDQRLEEAYRRMGATDQDLETYRAQEERHRRAEMKALAGWAEQAGHRARLTFGGGDPREAILGRARTRKADLLALGSRGARPLSSTFLGGVAAEVVRRASCDVLLVPVVPGAD